MGQGRPTPFDLQNCSRTGRVDAPHAQPARNSLLAPSQSRAPASCKRRMRGISHFRFGGLNRFAKHAFEIADVGAGNVWN